MMQFKIIEILRSTKSQMSKVKFGEFTKERSRIFSQRVPGRNSVGKDGGGESRPEKAEHLRGC